MVDRSWIMMDDTSATGDLYYDDTAVHWCIDLSHISKERRASANLFSSKGLFEESSAIPLFLPHCI